MNERPDGEYSIQRLPQKRYERSPAPFRRPVWLPASSYYVLATAATAGFFFFLWGILHEGSDDAPLMIAGIGASCLLGGAVILREVFLRKARNRYLAVTRKLDHNLRNFLPPPPRAAEESKLSLEKNAALVKSIQKKSEAARSLGKISSGHLEVFEICSEYLTLAEKQMETVRAGSPRLAGLRRGREIVGELHRYHLLSWAQIESRSLTQRAGNYVTISEKLNTAQEALTVLDSALRFYPNEPQLTESEAALKSFIASIKISHWIEQAERAAFKGNRKRAVSLYRDALFFLARENVRSDEREAIAEKINAEIEVLRGLSAKKEISKGTKKRLIDD